MTDSELTRDFLDTSSGENRPLHVVLSEPCSDPRERPAIPGESVRLQGRLHEFGALIEFYGSSFTSRLLDAFSRVYQFGNPGTTIRHSQQLRRFLLNSVTRAAEAAERDVPVVRVTLALIENRSAEITRADMADTVELFTGALRDVTDFSIIKTTKKITRSNNIQTLSAALQALAREGLWPDIGTIKGISGARAEGDNIKSLGQLDGPTCDKDENSSSEDSYAELMNRNKKRLERLRILMEDALIEEEALFDRGQSLIAASGQPSLDLVIEAVSNISSDYDREGKLKPPPLSVQICFPLHNNDVRLASTIRYIKAEFGGYCRLQQLTVGLQRVVSTCGGITRVMSYLEGGPRALMAAYTILLIDTGGNIQPCDDVAADPFTAKAKYGKIQLRRLSSIKNRAGYKPVDGYTVEAEESPDAAEHVRESDLKSAETEEVIEIPMIAPNVRISAAKAIEIWQKLSKPARERGQRAGNREAGYLWIIRHGNEPSQIRRYQHASWKHWWSDFLEENANDEVIGGLPIQRQMIRTTVLQLREARHDGDADMVALLSNQSSGRTAAWHYLSHNAIRRHLDEKIRQFQKLFEATVAGDEAQRPAQLELSPEEYSKRREMAVETGLGFICSNPNSGIQPGTKFKTCTRLDACSSCPLLRFVPTEKSVQALVLFFHSLKAAQDEFIARNPERWIRVWLPALALCIAVTNILSSSAKKFMLRRAEEFVNAGLDNQTLVKFMPW